MPSKRFSIYFGLGLILLAGVLAGCQSPQPTASPSAAPSLEPTAAEPTPTPTPESRTLVVCGGDEPQTLFLYGGSSASMWSVLEAIYDGPIDEISYQEVPVILQKMPSLADGDIVLQTIDVAAGDEVVDASGYVTALVEGTRVYPSGCTSADCAVTYDGKSALQMDQLKVTYKLLPDLKWSDGTALTAADSVYSYKLASDPSLTTSKKVVNRTVSYTAIDDQTVEWIGLPGYMNDDLSATFWTPLPEHLWGSLAAADLLTNDASAVKPVGWGPYQIDEWVKGDHITLSKNPNYFRAAEGLPYFDHLVYRFIGSNGEANTTAMLSGECDILDETAYLDNQVERVVDLQNRSLSQAYFTAGSEWEHLDFGITPASYDDIYSVAGGDRPDLFGDARTRQAFAYCADRQGVIDQALYHRSELLNTYLPPEHPLALADAPTYAYDPQTGAALLDEVGWKDADGDPSTPRVAQGVANVPDGTQLIVNYWTTEASQREETSAILANSLAQCGIQVNLQYYTPGDLFASGPDGPVFGRAFDLVQFSWESSSTPLCYLYVSSQIPSAANNWVGVNVSGYSNPEFDAACEAALNSPPGSDAYLANHQKAQEIFANDLPVIPLYLKLKVAASRLDLCGYSLDPTVRSSLWNIESINYGEGCSQ